MPYASLCMQIFLSAIIYGLIKLICDIDTLLCIPIYIYMDIIYYHMGVFVSDFVSARSSPYRPEPLGEGRYGL